MLLATLPPRRRHVGLGRVRVGAVVRTRRACGKVVRLRGLPDGTWMLGCARTFRSGD